MPLRLWNPPVFQGRLKPRGRYFEGWYFKLVARDRGPAVAVIPGVAWHVRPEGHRRSDPEAFVQVIDGITTRSAFVRYPIDAFGFSRRRFEVRIGSNRFDLGGMDLLIDDRQIRLRGHLDFVEPVPYPVRLLSPGVMGPYSFVPFMECYHGVVSMHHDLAGSLDVAWSGEESRTLSFHGGTGYIEKDWGRSFPSSWIWAQSNHFDGQEASFMLSVARIPWLRGHFTGFMAVLWAQGRFHTLATYTGARLAAIRETAGRLEIEIRDRDHRLLVGTWRARHAILRAPVEGRMERRIAESMDATVDVSLETPQGKVLFAGRGQMGGLEIAGDLAELCRGAGLPDPGIAQRSSVDGHNP